MENNLRQIFDHLFTHEANPTTLSRKDFLNRFAGPSVVAFFGAACSLGRGNYVFGNKITECDGYFPYPFEYTCYDFPEADKGFVQIYVGENDRRKFEELGTGVDVPRFCEAYLGTKLHDLELKDRCINEVLDNRSEEWGERFRFKTETLMGETYVVLGGEYRKFDRFKAALEAGGLMSPREVSEVQDRVYLRFDKVTCGVSTVAFALLVMGIRLLDKKVVIKGS